MKVAELTRAQRQGLLALSGREVAYIGNHTVAGDTYTTIARGAAHQLRRLGLIDVVDEALRLTAAGRELVDAMRPPRKDDDA